jgi:tetratricopeptide (TPR) repeat protein
MADKRKKREQKDKKRREAQRKAKAATPNLTEPQILQEVANSHKALVAGNPGKAEKILMKVQKTNPDHQQVLANLTAALESLDRIDDAITVAKRNVAAHPEHAESHNNLGATLKFKGLFDEARESFQRAADLDPSNTGAWRNLASVKRFEDPNDPALIGMLRQLDKMVQGDARRIELEFACGKAFEDLGMVAESFGHYDRGNKKKRITIPFRLDMLTKTIDLLIEHQGSKFAAAGIAEGVSQASPILVVGMPRSGSTLIEQVLASHPDVEGVGEVSDLVDTIKSFTKQASLFPVTLAELSPEALGVHGRTYMAKLRGRAPLAKRVVDKYLFNYMNAGFIARALPNAKIINCMREPMDNCFSCFKVHFTSMVMFAYDLEDLGGMYQQYRRLMDHWHTTFPGRVLDLSYESLVADQEGESRRLLEFCDLEWTDDVLRFHETERRVNTASATQVRKPIYTSSIAKWKQYEEHLGTLRDALGAYAPK